MSTLSVQSISGVSNIIFGNSVINAAGIFYGNSVLNTTAVAVGTNVTINTSSIAVGVLTVNSSSVSLGAISNVVINSSSVTVGSNVAVNTSAVTIGSNVIINTSAVSVGSNVTINSTAITVGSNLSLSTTSGLTVNASLSDNIGNVRDIPPVTRTTSYTLTTTDSGRFISTNSSITVPSGTFTAGQNISVYNNSAANISIIQGASVTMYLAGTSTTGNRTLTQRGLATIFCVGTNEFVISGGVLA